MSLASSGFCAPVHQTGTPNQEVSSPGSQGVGGLVGEFIIGEIEYSYLIRKPPHNTYYQEPTLID